MKIMHIKSVRKYCTVEPFPELAAVSFPGKKKSFFETCYQVLGVQRLMKLISLTRNITFLIKERYWVKCSVRQENQLPQTSKCP